MKDDKDSGNEAKTTFVGRDTLVKFLVKGERVNLLSTIGSWHCLANTTANGTYIGKATKLNSIVVLKSTKLWEGWLV